MEFLRGTMGGVNTHFEEWKKEHDGIDSQDVNLMIHWPKQMRIDRLKVVDEETLRIVMRFASVEFTISPTGKTKPFEFSESEFEKCERSRIRRPGVEPTQWNGETVPLSTRDRRALGIS